MSLWDKIKDGIAKEYDEAVAEFELSDIKDGLGDLWSNYRDGNRDSSGSNHAPVVTATGAPLSQPVPAQNAGGIFGGLKVNWQVVGVGVSVVSLLIALLRMGRK